ncbi:hypothetical protein KJN74_02700 [Candidatus Bathyarchaeota archaeon]|nr:hypothetical protein [Candidatus Bathyarchaeota archaeon]
MMLDILHKKWLGKRALSPVISSVIMTGAMIAILGVALGFANSFLWARVAEGDYDSSRQLIQSVGLQIDDVAWTSGRTETISYATQYGDVGLEPGVLTYTVSVVADGVTYNFQNTTGALMFNLPTYRYSISDNYWSKIFPEDDNSLTLSGTSAPVARVFEIEKVPMNDGDYIRVVLAPAIRILSSSINSSVNTRYIRMYLPILEAGESPRLYQSITVIGESVEGYALNSVESISVSVDFPRGISDGFNSNFFNFPEDSEVFDYSSDYASGYDNVVLEFYLSEVSVGFGL